MFDRLDLQIITELVAEEGYLTSEELARKAAASSKTIRKHIAEMKGALEENGIQLEMKKRVGIRAVVVDQSRYEGFTQKYNPDHAITSDEVIFQGIIRELVFAQDYLKLDELAESFFISRGKVNKFIRELRVVLAHYELFLETKPYYGVKIAGSEFHIRRFLASSFVQGDTATPCDSRVTSTHYDLAGELYQVICEVLQETQVFLPMQAIESLSQHLAIALERIRQGKLFLKPAQTLPRAGYQKEVHLIQEILRRVEKKYACEIPGNETDYFLIHFLSKRVLGKDQGHLIKSEINQLVEEILQAIYLDRNLDLRQDLDLRTMLALHLVPLLARLTYGLELKNPLLDQVKVACVTGFDLAIIANRMIEKKSGVPLSEDELSYLAMHFDCSLQKMDQIGKKRRILVIAPTRGASGQMIKQKFQYYFRDQLKEIVVCDLIECDFWLKRKQFDYLLTTVPIQKDLPVPVFDFEFFLTGETVRKIETFLAGNPLSKENLQRYFKKELFFGNVAVNNKEAAMDYLLTQVTQKEGLPMAFRESVMEREAISSTDFMENGAILHPNRLLTDETFIGVMTLPKPIFWEKRWVQLIFLVSVSQKESQHYKYLVDGMIRLLEATKVVQQIAKNSTHEALLEGLFKVLNQK